MTDNGDDGTASGRRSKVGRVIAERELDGLGDELERRWTGDRGERQSLRELADWFNSRVLEAAMAAAGEQVLDGEAANLYDLLTGDEVSGGTRTEAERRLARTGVDVDEVKRDFVSHQAVHTYLTDYRKVEGPSNETERSVDDATETIQRLRNRTNAVVERTVGALHDADEISVGDFDVFVDVRVSCNDCQRTYGVTDLLRNGGCDCQ
ncbi:rod-determining factor RdfA [Halorientalis litorea]|jgi:hypothetical protein|uniref:rod-determining factor RdfA n=1 Tax=Halorientalis litorea TaxID=2931977 RepID=UPI001FF38FD5|nr:rod-determining factor RdfA [Halorientalis litorea]